MSGVYIKGLKMPNEGFQETIILTHNKATVGSTRAWKGYVEYEAVSVDLHGRCIDADELKENWFLTELGNKVVDVGEIDAAPTIIPGD